MTKTERSSDGAAAVDRGYFWRPVTSDTPRGVKLQLINRSCGVAQYGTLSSGKNFWTHWAALPVFADKKTNSQEPACQPSKS